MIRDMEELVLSIKNEHIREYMEEARNCYNVKSYRACIILSTIAAMHDLRGKIKNLASSITEAKALDEEIEKRIRNEENYENYMIEQAASIAILSTSETESIKSYTNLRNRCAHPNEYVATAEEARMVFTGFYDNVISKPALLGPAYIRVIKERLKKDRLFPDYNVHTVKVVAEEELKNLHPNAIVPLANSLISVLDDASIHGKNEWINAASLLAGLLVLQEDEGQIRSITRKLSRLLETKNSFDSILITSRSFPKIVSFLSPTERKRYMSHLKLSIGNSMEILKVRIIHELFTEEILDVTEISEIINVFLEQIPKSIKIISGNTDRSSVNELKKWSSRIEKLNILETDVSFYDTLIELINDSDYNIVNDAILLMKSLNKEFLNRMNDKQIVNTVILIIRKANGPGRGADEARSILKENFKEIPEIINHFVDSVTRDSTQYLAYIGGTNFWEKEFLNILHRVKRYSDLSKLINHLKESLESRPEELETELAYLNKILKKENIPEWDEISSEIDLILKEIKEDK